jgi:c-di-GMP-binding flagellar brake protein YcgR
MKTAEHRQETRHPFHWPVAIVFDSTEDQETYHGVTKDLSLIGCSILTEHNVFSEHPVSILLSLPTEHPGGRRRIVEAKAQMVYTVLSAGHRKFRCGIHFLNFKGKGRATLKRAIEIRALSNF